MIGGMDDQEAGNPEEEVGIADDLVAMDERDEARMTRKAADPREPTEAEKEGA